MIPNYIECGKYTGGGLCFIGSEETNGSRIECVIEITEDRENLIVSGDYQHDLNVGKHSFTGTVCKLNLFQRIGSIDFHDHTLGNISGVLTVTATGVLLLARSENGEIQICQRWDELAQDRCFGINGIVMRVEQPTIHYALSFGSADPRQTKSNVVALGDSA